MSEPVKSLTLSDLDFEEAELLEDTLDMSIDEIGNRLQSNKPKIRIIRAIKWLEMRRADPSATFDDAKKLSVMAAFDLDGDEPAAEGKGDAKPPPKRNGRRSASSTASSPPPNGGG